MTNTNFLPEEYRTRKNRKLKAVVLTLAIGISSLGLIQKNFQINSDGEVKSRVLAADETKNSGMAEIIFGKGYGDPGHIDKVTQKQVELITTRSAFFAALGVVQKHEEAIRKEAKAKNIPEEAALGVAFLENGGSETAVSSAGAAGIFQLMPQTMIAMGYSPVERNDPEKSIKAGLKYLKQNYDHFGDLGLAVWSYHAGEGNVCKAVKIHAAANGVGLPSCFENPKSTRNYISENNLTINALLSNSAVQKQLTSRLSDESDGYPYKVMASSHLFELSKRLSKEEFARRILMLNAKAITLRDFFAAGG